MKKAKSLNLKNGGHMLYFIVIWRSTGIFFG
jgi:hypothetical protein